MSHRVVVLFFFNDTSTTEIFPLSLHDALPICPMADAHPLEQLERAPARHSRWIAADVERPLHHVGEDVRSEEHTSELQSQSNLECRLLLEKKKLSPRTLPRILHTRSPPPPPPP